MGLGNEICSNDPGHMTKIVPKVSDRQVGADSVDPDHTACSLIRVYSVHRLDTFLYEKSI